MFFNFVSSCWKCTLWRLKHFLSSCIFPVNSILSAAKCKRPVFLMKYFFPLCNCCYDKWNYLFFHSFPWQPWLSWQTPSVHQYRSVYGWQTWQDCSYLEWLPPIKLLNSLITWSCKMTWQTKISTAMRMTTKLGKMVTPLAGFLPVKSNFPLMKWSC